MKINVADKGIGIPEEEVNQVFKPFFKSERRVKQNRHNKGVGLGLFVSKSICD